jgi:hypothetical protein
MHRRYIQMFQFQIDNNLRISHIYNFISVGVKFDTVSGVEFDILQTLVFFFFVFLFNFTTFNVNLTCTNYILY